MPTLTSFFRVTIDTDARAPDQGGRLAVLMQAAPFGSAAACREAVLAAYRPDFPHVSVIVEAEPVLVGGTLAPGLYDARTRQR